MLAAALYASHLLTPQLVTDPQWLFRVSVKKGTRLAFEFGSFTVQDSGTYYDHQPPTGDKSSVSFVAGKPGEMCTVKLTVNSKEVGEIQIPLKNGQSKTFREKASKDPYSFTVRIQDKARYDEEMRRALLLQKLKKQSEKPSKWDE